MIIYLLLDSMTLAHGSWADMKCVCGTNRALQVHVFVSLTLFGYNIFCSCTKPDRSRDSAVGVATGYVLDARGVGV
jgi:hypothetical protein